MMSVMRVRRAAPWSCVCVSIGFGFVIAVTGTYEEEHPGYFVAAVCEPVYEIEHFACDYG